MVEEDPSQRRGFDPTTLLHHLINRRTNPTTSTAINNNNNRFSLLISSSRNRQIVRESSSILVRDSVAVRLDDRQNDWEYSKPVVILDVLWNLAFDLVSTVVLSSTLREHPSTPLRVWIIGYALQCLFHVGFVYFEYRRRNSASGNRENGEIELSSSSEIRSRRLESTKSMVSFIWWMIGVYWIVAGGQALLQDAPRLYWLTVMFLAFDVYFAVICIALACIIGISICCCFPCTIAIPYTVAVQEGASEDDSSILLKYKFRQINQPGKFDSDKKQEVVPVAVMEPGTSNVISELALPPEDSECCICLSQYVDGAELHTLPCNHHFHCGCILKWLRINMTCPLCKYNILHGDELV